MMRLRSLVGGLSLLSLSGLALSAATDFSGTTWQLLSIQSMDEAQGTTKVEDPSRFTLEFGHDGRAAFKLDCNRGTGGYTVAPASDGASGSLSFGPIAATRALCPPPHLDERVARDLPYVRGYLLKEGKLYLSLMADGGIYEWAPVHTAGIALDPERTAKQVRFARGKSSIDIRDRIGGHQYVDYQLSASAGQRMTVSLKGSNGANSFNVLPPDADNAAMGIGEYSGNRFDGLLPDDGLYTIRVFLNRAAARRGEASNFTLSVGVTGKPLKPVPAKIDATFPGTRYHARTPIPCTPAQASARECEAYVVRRAFDGTATVEARWEQRQRRILFIKGVPRVADTFQPMTYTEDDNAWTIRLGDDERFVIPKPLVFGG